MSQIFDWYLLLTPLFAISIVMSLATIKQAIKERHSTDIETLTKAKQQQKLNQQIERAQAQQYDAHQQVVKTQNSQYIKTLSYLVRNHSFLEICMTRYAKNKLPMLLAFSILSILCYMAPNMYLYSLIGLVLVVVFLVAESFFEVDPVDSLAGQEQEYNLTAVKQAALQQQNMQNRNKILYVVFGVLSCGLGLLLCGLIYHNYLNSLLSAFFVNLMVNLALDLFVIRPIGFLIISFPLKLNLRVQTHIDHENLRQQFANISITINTQNCAVNNLSPKKRKLNGSPTKVPKAIPKTDSQNQSENQGLSSALQQLRKIKKEKRGGNELMTPISRRNQVEDEYTLKNLLEEASISQNTPVNRFNYDTNLQYESQNKGQRRRKDSELVIVQFKNNNEKQIDTEENGEVIEGESSPNKNFIHSNLDLDDLPEFIDKNKSSEGQQARENGDVNVIKLVNVNGDDDFQDEDVKRDRRDRKDSFMTLQNKNKLMSIDENGQDREIQEIDLNSPEKRRNQLQTIMQEISEDHKGKKKAKHYQSGAKKRVIRFTSGEPYLQYLPKMLAKEQNKHTKRSQPITYKGELENYHEKPRKSLNKIKAPRHQSVLFGGGDENAGPQAIEIQDL